MFEKPIQIDVIIAFVVFVLLIFLSFFINPSHLINSKYDEKSNLKVEKDEEIFVGWDRKSN